MYALKDAGIARLNISLDTLKPELFSKITGSNAFDMVMQNIHLASDVFDEVTKINTVVLDINVDEVYDIYNHFKSNPKIVPRFLQLTYKGDDEFTDKHRLEVRRVEDILPVSKSTEIEVPYPEYTNPVAKYFKNSAGIFSIIPQKHNCIGRFCNKLWYINGEIFTCKMKNAGRFVVDENLAKNMSELLSSGCIKEQNMNGHRIKNSAKLRG
jgi:cyclic pyranopterin phosphate synthase